ncbi:MAG: Type 1 glutamine amidotransferase-like domain-containing protein [Microgenomates group bacterium]
MKLFLTSSVSEVAHDIVKHLDLSKGNKLVFIDTAAEPERGGDITWLINDRKSLVNAGFDVVDYSITGKNSEEIKSFLAEFDYIYMSGGNTLHLLTESYKSGFIDLIKDLVKDKVYIGTSAGSIITGPSVPEYLRDTEKQTEFEKEPAYNLVNFTIAPHWGSIHFKDEYLGSRLKIAYVDTNQPYVLLNDRQYVLVEDNQFKIIDLNS